MIEGVYNNRKNYLSLICNIILRNISMKILKNEYDESNLFEIWKYTYRNFRGKMWQARSIYNIEDYDEKDF